VKIHPSAIIDPHAKIADDVEIGPFSVVEAGVEIAAGCRLAANVNVRTGTVLNSGITVSEGAVLGGFAQHQSAPPHAGTIEIGEGCVLREHVTVHRAMDEGNVTRVGKNCLLMVGAHVAHDCQLGDQVILTNGAMLGGHVEVGDRVCLGGNSAVHQFCRIGRLAMVGGCTKIVQDVPPFMLTDGATAMIVGLNRVGLKRAGFDSDEIMQLKSAYRLIYREGLLFQEIVARLEQRFSTGVASEFASFFQSGSRGFVQERRSPPHVALRVHPAVDEIDEPRRLAG